MARKNATITVETLPGTGIITFTIVGQEQPLILNVAELADDVRNHAMFHGLVQKVSDAAALSKNDDGTPANPADKFAAMATVVARLTEGNWKKPAGEVTQPTGLIFRAYYAVICAAMTSAKKPVPDESVLRELYDRKDRSAQLALRNNPDIAAEITRLKSANVNTSTVDTDSLLGELSGL